MRKSRRLLVAAIAAGALLTGGAVGGIALRDPGTVAASSEAGAAAQSITVHGNWRFDIRNADGSKARTVEFENALFLTGQRILSRFLTSGYPVSSRRINVSGTPFPCDLNATTPTSCFILETGQAETNPAMFANLVTTYLPGDSTTPAAARWSGSFVAARDSAIQYVYSYVLGTDQNLSPFTTKVLAAPVNVLAGQQVVVTVTFTFS